MALPASLITTYRLEYENTDISIDELCLKYDVSRDDLINSNTWHKTSECIPELVTSEVQQVKNKVTKIAMMTAEPLAPQDIAPTSNDMLEQIEEFKRIAIAYALKFIKTEAEYADIKDFKEVVNIVDSIEKSYKNNRPTETTVNIAIQNLVERFSDDC